MNPKKPRRQVFVVRESTIWAIIVAAIVSGLKAWFL